MLNTRIRLAAVCLVLAATPDVLAQEILIQGIRVRLSEQDNAWIARACERRTWHEIQNRTENAWPTCSGTFWSNGAATPSPDLAQAVPKPPGQLANPPAN